MNRSNTISYLFASAAAATLAASSLAAPSAVFVPSPSAAEQQPAPKGTADDIQILSSAPTQNVVILGELRVDSGSDTSLSHVMNTALAEAKSKGADFVALAGADNGAGLVLGKMVPVGHGRSMFVAGPVLGSEVGRIAALSSGPVSGKMVPMGHGRSMFVAEPVAGSEADRIAAIPSGSLGTVHFVLGRFSASTT